MSNTVAHEPKPQDVMALTCDVSQLDDELLVSIVITNKGQRPVILDRTLVFLVDFTFIDVEGNTVKLIRFDNKDVLNTNRGDEVVSRFISLPPGKSISRDIRPVAGFRVFEYAVAESDRTVNATGYECSYRIPASHRIAKVKVKYGVGHGLREGFLAYTRRSLESLSVFEGPCVANCDVRKVNQR